MSGGTGDFLQRGFRGFTLAAIPVCIFLLLPILVIFPVSLTTERYLSLPRNGISFRHYATLLQDPVWLEAMLTSLWLAVASSTAATAIAVLFGVALWKLKPRYGPLLSLSMLSPMIVPTIVDALAFYRFFAEIGLVGTAAGVLIAHVVKNLPLAVVTISLGLLAVDPRIEQAARIMGAGPLRAVWAVVVPGIRTSIVSSLILCFIHSWDEVVVTIFVAGRSVYTLPVKIWEGIQDNVSPVVAALSAILTVITLAVLAIHTRKG